MVKTKAYAQHADDDSSAGQPGDTSWWQREMFKRFVVGGGPDSDILAQPYFSSMPLHYPQRSWSHPLFQQFSHPAMPQSPAPMQEQEKEHDSQENGVKQSPPNKAKPSHNCETSGSSAGKGGLPYHKSAGDSNYDDFYIMGGTGPSPYSSPGGYMFPMPPHPGQLDPLMFWMQYMRQQAAYLQSITGHGNGHQSPLPAPSQRGFIKIPSGIPQKQTQLWETQSSENVQLWATVTQLCASLARVQAEVFCQRGKIMKLEDDLEMMKTRQDDLSEALKGRTIFSQTKREKRKRTAAVPVAILGLPAHQPCPLRAQVKKARGIMNEGDPLKHANELTSETNTVCTHQNLLKLSNKATQNGNGNCSATVSLTETESRTDAGDKDNAHGQQLNLSSYDVDTISPSRQENGSSSIGVNLPDEQITESHNRQNMYVKQECKMEPSPMAAERSMESNSKEVLFDDSCREGQTGTGNIVCIIAANEARQRTDVADAGVNSEQVGMHKVGNSLVSAATVSRVDSIPSTLLPISDSLTRSSVTKVADMVAHGQSVLKNSRMDATPLCNKEAEAMNACSIDDFDGPDEWTEEGMEVLER